MTTYAADTTETTAQEATPSGLAAGAHSLGLDGKLFLAQIINFLILVFLLRKFLYGPLVGLMEKRRKQIADSVAKAEEIEKRAAEFEKEHAQKINKAKEEALEIINKAKDAAETLRQESIAATNAETDKMLARAQAEISQNKEQMLAELKHEVGALVVSATAKIIGKTIDKETEEKLIKEAVSEVKR